jgi:hypothetical protein
MSSFMPTDPIFYLVGIPAIFVIGLGKGAFGGGLAIIGVPLLALVTDPVDAAIIIAVVASTTDIFAVKAFPMRTCRGLTSSGSRRRWSWGSGSASCSLPWSISASWCSASHW